MPGKVFIQQKVFDKSGHKHINGNLGQGLALCPLH